MLARRLSALAFTVTLGAAGYAATPAAADTTSPILTLRSQVAQALSGTPASVISLSATVRGLGTVTVAPTAAMPPASNEKILTSVSALDQLGPGYTFTTNFETNAPVRADGVALGDLVVVGSGDPSIDDAELATVAQQLRKQGIWHVHGKIYVDDSRYAQDVVAPGWKPDFLGTEAGPVSAFAIDNNTKRTDSAYLTSPTLGNAEIFRQILAQAGIGVAGGDASGEPAVPVTNTLASITSQPLSALVTAMNKDSVNWYAEMLLHEIGAHRSGTGSRGTGIDAINTEAAHLGQPVGALYDGSGLSSSDRESSATVIDWLAAANTTSFATQFMQSLPQSCINGTLKHRLCGPWLTGRIFAKTGTLDHESALSGYTHTQTNRLVTFSILTSGFNPDQTATVVQHLDAVAAVFARFDQ